MPEVKESAVEVGVCKSEASQVKAGRNRHVGSHMPSQGI